MAIGLHGRRRELWESQRLRRVSWEVFWVTTGQAVAMAGSLVGVRVLTGLLSPSAYGRFALALTAVTLVNQLVTGPLAQGAQRFYAPAADRHQLWGYLRAIRHLLLGSAGVLALLVSVCVLWLTLTRHAAWVGLTVAAFLLAVLDGYVNSVISLQNAARQRLLAASYGAMNVWLRVLIAAVILRKAGSSSEWAVAAYCLASALVLASQLLSLKRVFPREQRGTEEGEWRKQMLLYSWPFATWAIFTWAQIASDRWSLQIFSTTKEVGLYAVLFQLGYSPVASANGLLLLLIAPVVFQRSGDASEHGRTKEAHALIRNAAIVTLSATTIGFCAAASLHSWVFVHLAAPEYRQVSYLWPWMLLAGGIFATGQVFALKQQGDLSTKSLIIPKVVTAAIGVGLNVVGARVYGIVGVVGAGVGFAVVYLTWMAFLWSRGRVVT
jgi:O-antigen/teichoic acid export membrane protein